ncbi:uncharacterized protein LOC122298936 [Carya illinoinensis]|uniref:uncharacterized protein LOC122298936 n=1 Tax=Carya illinoinensis TaxID=32201 RepID=UPI001C71E6AC|nr:uncharacterized protein LOC122298936 [Carya illinoinensis]
MVVRFSKALDKYGPPPFRFQNMWCSHENFLRVVQEVWSEPVAQSGLCKLVAKLKKKKAVLRHWNVHVFGSVDCNIKNLEDRLDLLESQMQNGYNDELEMEYLVSKIELETWERREELRLAQIAKEKWLAEGDSNTGFFHVVLKQRRKSSLISSMRLEDGSSLVSPEEVHEGVVRYFQNFLTDSGEREPSEMEVKDTFSSIPKTSSSGLDGFGSAFYLTCWEIIEKDLVEAASDFFRGTPLPPFFTSSFFALIPKKEMIDTSWIFRVSSNLIAPEILFCVASSGSLILQPPVVDA